MHTQKLPLETARLPCTCTVEQLVGIQHEQHIKAHRLLHNQRVHFDTVSGLWSDVNRLSVTTRARLAVYCGHWHSILPPGATQSFADYRSGSDLIKAAIR